jgi:hypothetical protein
LLSLSVLGVHIKFSPLHILKVPQTRPEEPAKSECFAVPETRANL